MLTPDQLAKITEKNLENLVRKAAEGKPLTDKEMSTLEAAARRAQEQIADNDALSAEKLCLITNLTDQRHRQLAKENYFPPPIKGVYQLTPTLQGVIRHLRAQAAKASNSIEQEKLKKLSAERKLAELKLSRERKESFEAQAVLKAWENIIVTIRQKLLSMPSQVSPRLAYLNDQHEIEKALEKQVNESLVDLSKPMKYDEEPEEDDSENEIHQGNKPSLKATKAPPKTKRRTVGGKK